MFYKNKAPLAELIILTLAKSPQRPASELIQQLSQNKAYSFQAIYKELKLLQTKGVILKEAGKFSLNLVWLNQLSNFVQQTQSNYTNQVASLIPKNIGESRKWFFTDLLALDDFWAHSLTYLIQNTPSKTVYEWIPHPWFELIHTEKEDNFRKMLKCEEVKLYLAISGDNYLDKICKKIWPKDTYTYSFGSSLNLYPENTYVDIIGDYIITLKLPRKFTERLNSYYQKVESKSDFIIADTLKLLSEKVKVSAKIENNPAKAKKLTNKFIKYFGI